MTSATPKYPLLFVAALIAGVSFWVGDKYVAHDAARIAWKGSGVALLALWAALNARNRDGWQLAVVLALGAIGDVLLELDRTAGGAVFLAGHVVAAALYWRNRRSVRTASQTALAVLLFVGAPVIAYLLPADRGGAPSFALYALGVGAMAGSAWASRFPRYRVGLGAVMFLASDLLIFGRMGPLAASPVPGWLIWPLYFGGQALIAWGAVTTLLHWKDDEDLHHRL